MVTILADHATGLTVIFRCRSYSHFLFMWDAVKELRLPCGKDVGDLGVAEIEEPVDRPGTTIGT